MHMQSPLTIISETRRLITEERKSILYDGLAGATVIGSMLIHLHQRTISDEHNATTVTSLD